MVISRTFKNRSLKKCCTETIMLGGGTFKNDKEVKEYRQDVSQRLLQYGLAHYAYYLVHTYGRQTDTILEHFSTLREEQADIRLALTELWFTVTYEMVQTPLDFFNRRTGMLYFNLPRLIRLQEPILEALEVIFNWDEATCIIHRYQLDKAIKEAQLK